MYGTSLSSAVQQGFYQQDTDKCAAALAGAIAVSALGWDDARRARAAAWAALSYWERGEVPLDPLAATLDWCCRGCPSWCPSLDPRDADAPGWYGTRCWPCCPCGRRL
eukprot:TRINITY_DN19153_c1_g2_i1.p4 TRINITY_DN19153_c1_g2~~TRINITY_DN19153_c1_g2_i1.p4  ORF type:complete len:108 (+),score=15.03 TRINITY_DN19153_c1_g2_i1:273-596(+)